jgi:hypothetical protein
MNSRGSERMPTLRGTRILATDSRHQQRQKLARIALDEIYQFVAVKERSPGRGAGRTGAASLPSRSQLPACPRLTGPGIKAGRGRGTGSGDAVAEHLRSRGG